MNDPLTSQGIPGAFARPLLHSKLVAPRVRPNAVARSHLVEKINQGLRSGMVLISAPAGFGKTSLLAQWAEQSHVSLAWAALDEGENDPIQFFAYLAAAVQQAAGQPAQHLTAMLAAPQPLPALILANGLLADLEGLGREVVIVLDDYHSIHETGLHQALTHIIERLPDNTRLLLATRADPPIALARLRASGQFLELRASDLRFSSGESGRFFQQGMELNLTNEQLAALDARTEGWAAGMQMAGLSMRGRSDLDAFIRDFSGSNRFILDYLLEEVIRKQPETIQNFLLQSAVLERLNGEVCDSVLERSGSQALLEQIERDNLFLIPLDEERSWYRFHTLFSDLLRSRLEKSAPGLIPQLHKRASAWFEGHGFQAEAVRHAIQANDGEYTARLIDRYGQERWAFSDRVFLNLMRQLPDDFIQDRPTLGIFKAWMLIISGQIEGAERLLAVLQTFVHNTRIGEYSALAEFIKLVYAYIAALRGQFTDQALPGPQVLEMIPATQLGMRNSADVVYAMLCVYQGDLATAAAILPETIRRDLAADGTTAVPVAGAFLARISAMQGRLSEAEATCRKYIQTIQARGSELFYLPGNLYLGLADALRERGELDEAEKLAQEGIRLNQPWNIPAANATGAMLLARLRIDKQDWQSAAASLDLAESQLAGRLIPPDTACEIRATRALLLTRQGMTQEARASLEASENQTLPPSLAEIIQTARARILLAQRQPRQALDILAELETLSAAGGRTGRLITVLLLKSCALWSDGAAVRALENFERCLALARQEGHLAVFMEMGDPLPDLLQAYLRQPSSPQRDYALKVAAVLKPASEPGKIPGGELVEALTARELEVLERIAKGDSNQEIAQRLVISLSAVKKHTGNIYGKLGVNSRTQAILRARELGLLAPG